MQKLHIPIIKASYVKRIKYTKPQSSLNQKSRHRNMNGAFYVQKLFEIRHVAIIDDIITTGSTANSLSKELKQQGIKHISLWALARTN